LPTGVALDGAGNIYIADPTADFWDVRKVTASTGIISLVAGDGTGGYSGDGGPAISAALEAPNRVAVDAAGNVYIADSNNPSIRIRIVAASSDSGHTAGYIYTLAGNGTACANPTTSCGDLGPATSAELNGPVGVAVDNYGNIYIGDSLDNKIRVVGTYLVSTASSSVRVSIPVCGGFPRKCSVATGIFAVTSSAGFNVGDTVTVAGNSNSSLDGSFPVSSIPNGTTVDLTMTGLAGQTGTGGTLTDNNW